MCSAHSVYLKKCQDYDSKQLLSFFDETLGRQSGLSLRSSTVCLKPNLVSSRFVGPACTDPRFILALAQWCKDHGARVILGDSPAFGLATTVLKKLQVDGALDRLGVKSINFTSVLNKRLECGIDIGVAREAVECDYFINVPKVKAHGQMYVTLAVKNVFGIVVGVKKAMLHMRYGERDNLFCNIIVDLLDLLPEHFSVLDGIVAMHNGGPIKGEELNLGCLGFAQDPVSLDTALFHALKLQPEKSKLWCEAQRRNLGGTEYKNLIFPALTPDAFHDATFMAPEEISPIRFNPLRFLGGNIKRLHGWITGISH